MAMKLATKNWIDSGVLSETRKRRAKALEAFLSDEGANRKDCIASSRCSRPIEAACEFGR